MRQRLPASIPSGTKPDTFAAPGDRPEIKISRLRLYPIIMVKSRSRAKHAHKVCSSRSFD
jgi:hypothetical protein